MYVYHDFDYVKHILNSEANNGLLLYYKCLDRIIEEKTKDEDNKLWQAFINSGSEGQTFEEFKAALIFKSPITTKSKLLMSNEEKTSEETRIIKNAQELRKLIEKKDQESQYKKIASIKEG